MPSWTSHHLPRAAALIASLTLAGCAQKIVITEYPVKQATFPDPRPCGSPVPGSDGVDPKHPKQSRYWSAYAYLDPQNIVRAWDAKGLSHVFISAEVRIPASGKPITREFPLFTIQDGAIQEHAGVDMLQKIPILVGAREQLSIKLKVKYLAGAAAMDQVRKVLSIAAGFARPLLEGYPAASQILSAATATIDELAREKKGLPGNSHTKYVIAEELSTHGGGQSLTFAFLLPQHGEVIDADGDWANHFGKGLTVCTDKPLALCQLESPTAEVGEGDHCYQQEAVEIPYITVTMRPYEQVYDPLVLQAQSPQACNLVTATSVANARNYLQANRSLFHPEDTAQIEANLELAQRYLDAQPIIYAGDVPALVEFVNRNGNPQWKPWVAQGECRTPSDPVCDPSDPECVNPRPCERLAADAWALWECNFELWDQIPARYVWKLWDRPIQETTNYELAYVGRVLSTVFAQLGRPDVDFGGMQLDQQTMNDLENNVFAQTPTLAQFYWRLRGLQRQAIENIANLQPQDLCGEQAGTTAQYHVYLYCEECDRALEKLAPANCRESWKAVASQARSEMQAEVFSSVESKRGYGGRENLTESLEETGEETGEP